MMMDSNKDIFALKHPPPPNLSKEHRGVWIGWHNKSDREVAREAAAKGIDIKLIVLFLSLRKKIKHEEADDFFKREVRTWVKELLDRKQIFKVSHVLKNIGEDPDKELLNTFYSTVNRDLREYIGQHLRQFDKLDSNMQQLWHFLDLILDNNVLILKYKLAEDSIECLDKQNEKSKSEIAARLFLRTHDNLLFSYLTGEVIWNQLLYYNDINLLKVWINIRYNGWNGNHNIPDSILQIFKTFPITTDMISHLNKPEIHDDIRQPILNEFCKFGIFSDDDSCSLVNILHRVDQSDNILNIYDVISKKCCNIPLNNFIKLLVEFCLENDLFHVLNVCLREFDISDMVKTINSPHLSLISDFRKLTNNFEESILCGNIFNVSKFLCNDVISFFNENPLILLSLIFFTKDVTLQRILSENSLVILDTELIEPITKSLQHFKVLNTIYEMKDIERQCNLTYYDLLEKHLHVNVKELYAFQFQNNPVPNFNTPHLVQDYGYSKEIDYLFYIRQIRPSIACKAFMINEYKLHNCIKEECVELACNKIYKLALRNFNSTEITSSCVAFLEMIGVNSDFLRVSIRAANILLESGQDIPYIINLFMNIKVDPYQILTLLEVVIINKIDFEELFNPAVFIDAIKKYDLVYKFAVLFKLKLPELFLHHCANYNMWLPFLIFAQIKNYPIEQIKICLQSLKNPNLLEHINHGVIHDIQVDEKNILMRERDLRTSFFLRIGVQKSIDSLNRGGSVHSSITSQTSYGSNASSSGSELLEIDISNTKTTLLQTLIRCHNSTDPPRALLQACQLYRNPLLAILATTYEPDSIITNWLTWLAVSSDLCPAFTNFESMIICPKFITGLLNDCMKNGFSRVLQQSFEIFIPSNPLKYFADFLNSCLSCHFDATILKLKLDSFKSSLNKCRRYSILPDTDHDMTYLNNKEWIENTALMLLSSAIEYNVTSLYDQIQLLQVLKEIDIENCLHCPNIQDLIDILKCTFESGCYIKFNIATYFDDKNGRSSVIECINKLLEEKLFQAALRIAQIKGLPMDLIVIKEWQHNFENWNHVDLNFWHNSSDYFNEYNITADCVIEFYLHHIDSAKSNFEKYQLLKLAHEWAERFKLSNRYTIEKRKWMAYIILEDKWKKSEDTIFKKESLNCTYKEMIEMLEAVTKYEGELTTDSLNMLEQLLKEALNQGCVWLSLKLEKMFGCKLPDLDMLKLCFSLAEGIILPYQISTEQRLLLTSGASFRRLSHRKTFLSNRLSSLSSTSPINSSFGQTTDTVDSAPVQDTLALLYALIEKITVGNEIAYKVFMTYRISLNIEIPYHFIVPHTDYIKLLQDALENDCMHKLDVVHDFIRVYNWTKEEVADVICEQIVSAASKYVESKSDDFLMWNIKMDQEFHLVLQLIQDGCSLLGYKIYAYASAKQKAQVLANLDFKISELALVIELLIISHNCFTADCNMEGISNILKKCQTVISHLLTLRSWKLIVRLLTGVGRYTEMTYVFQILRAHDQFEFLLRKGSRKDNGLKIALLDYLKKFCPDNHELYKIVALHFTLFSEVAHLWEREAQNTIKDLIEISKSDMQNNRLNPDPYVLFNNTDGTRRYLNKALKNYTHATEFHLQGETLAKGMNAAKQAELIALQMSLIRGLPNNGTAVCLLNLNEIQISALISSELSFDQSLILVQAYSYHPDWASVLFEQCILRNNTAYLKSFVNRLTLTDSIVHDISRKFLSANINTPSEMRCMKDILKELPSVHTKYRIASELGFTDVVEDLLAGAQLAYLKDTVWKKGYRS